MSFIQISKFYCSKVNLLDKTLGLFLKLQHHISKIKERKRERENIYSNAEINNMLGVWKSKTCQCNDSNYHFFEGLAGLSAWEMTHKRVSFMCNVSPIALRFIVLLFLFVFLFVCCMHSNIFDLHVFISHILIIIIFLIFDCRCSCIYILQTGTVVKEQ